MTVADVDLEALPTPGLLIGGEMLTGPTADMYPHTYAANGNFNAAAGTTRLTVT